MTDTPYTEANYAAYREMMIRDYPDGGVGPGSFEEWVAWNTALDLMDSVHVADPDFSNRKTDGISLLALYGCKICGNPVKWTFPLGWDHLGLEHDDNDR